MPSTDSIIDLMAAVNSLKDAGIFGFMLLFLVVCVVGIATYHRQSTLRIQLSAEAQKRETELEAERLKQQNIIDSDLRELLKTTADAIGKSADGIEVISIRNNQIDVHTSKIAETLDQTMRTLLLIKLALEDDNKLLGTLHLKTEGIAENQASFNDAIAEFRTQIQAMSNVLQEHARDATQRGFERIETMSASLADIKQQFDTLVNTIQYIKAKVDTQELPAVIIPDEPKASEEAA